MKRLSLFLIGLFFLLSLPVAVLANSYTFSDDFNDGNLVGWHIIRGVWSNTGNSLQSSTDDYSTIILSGSDTNSLYQSITVDAYFDPTDNSYYRTDRIAQLRLRTGDNWNSGYLADIQTTQARIQNTAQGGNPVLGFIDYSSTTPFTSSGWYTLCFEIFGQGAETNLKLWIDDELYLDFIYNDITGENDTGSIGLGRLIEYDNVVACSSDTAPVPEPSTMLLFGSGLFGLAGVVRKKMKR